MDLRETLEKTVIYRLLSEQPDAKMFAVVEPQMFVNPSLGDIFRSFKQAFLDSGESGVLKAANELHSRENIAGLDFSQLLEECKAAAQSAQGGWVQVETLELGKALKEYATRDKLSSELAGVASQLVDLRSGTGARLGAQAALNFAQKTLLDTQEEEGVTSIGKETSIFFDRLDGKIPDVPPIPTTIPKLNEYLEGGIRPGELFILAARPGCGKTTLALDFARNAVFTQGFTVFFKSLEMTRRELMNKVAASHCLVPLSYFSKELRNENDEEYQTLLAHRDELETIGEKLLIDDGSDGSLQSFIARLRELKTAYSDLKLVVVDYIQLMTAGSKENRQEDVSIITRELKLLAKDLDVAVIALSQLNRESEKQRDKTGGRPRLDNLRSSGSIEQDANQVLLLWRYTKAEAKTGEEAPVDIEDEVPAVAEEPYLYRFRGLLEKNRGGMTGEFKLLPLLDKSTFQSVSSWEEAEMKSGRNPEPYKQGAPYPDPDPKILQGVGMQDLSQVRQDAFSKMEW